MLKLYFFFHSVFPRSFTGEATSYTATSDDFFCKNRDGLRPFLTREENAFMKSHFHFISSSTEYASALNPNENTTMTYEHRTPSICYRNTTSLPYRGETRPSGIPVDRGCGFDEYCSCSARYGLIPSSNEELSLMTNRNHEITNPNLRVPGCQHSTKTIFKENTSQYTEVDKEFIGSDCFLEGFVPPSRQTENNLVIMEGCGRFHQSQEQVSEIPRMTLHEQCHSLCLPEKSPFVISTCDREVESHRTGSVVPCDSTSAFGTQGKQELGCADPSSVKRKSTTVTEHYPYPQRQRKRHCVGDDTNEIMKHQVPNKITHVNDARKTHPCEPLPMGSWRRKDTNLKINESCEISRSLEITESHDQASAITSGNKTSGAITSDTITSATIITSAANTSATECKPGSKTRKSENLSIMIDLTNETNKKVIKSDVGQISHQDPNGRKPSERKDINEVIKTVKPIQRELLESGKTSLKSGVAFDHHSMPRLIGVLPSATATVISSLKVGK